MAASMKSLSPQPVDLMGVDLDVHPAPGQGKIRVVPFPLRQLAHLIDEVQGRLEILESERLDQVVFLHRFPRGHFPQESPDRFPLEGRNSAATRNAVPVDQVANFGFCGHRCSFHARGGTVYGAGRFSDSFAPSSHTD